MGLVQKGEVDSNPHIEEDYYLSQLTDLNSYERDGKEAMGIVMQFEVRVDDSSSVEIPFFAPAKLSISRERESSRLAENLENLGLLTPVLSELGVEDEVMSEKHKWVASDDSEFEELRQVVEAVFTDQVVRVNVEDNQDGDASQVSKFSKLFNDDEESEDVLFDEDEEEEEEEE